jgi:hypothetical protein
LSVSIPHDETVVEFFDGPSEESLIACLDRATGTITR